jgi:hypothetical protein
MLLVLLFASLGADPAAWAHQPAALTVPWALGCLGIAIAAFVLPMRGMHDLLARRKRAVLDACAERLARVTAAIHEAVDAADVGRADGLSKLQASLIAERELVGRVSTWPWERGQLGAVVSAVVLPIALFVMTRLIERFV